MPAHSDGRGKPSIIEAVGGKGLPVFNEKIFEISSVRLQITIIDRAVQEAMMVIYLQDEFVKVLHEAG